MDKKSKILLFAFFAIIFISAGIAFYKVIVLKSYYVKMETECDPEKEKCFVRECDPESDNECPKNVDERASYYKIIEKKAKNIPVCNPNDENCPELTCEGDKHCQETLCDEKTVVDGETCNDPEVYKKEQEEKLNNESECDSESEDCGESKSIEEPQDNL